MELLFGTGGVPLSAEEPSIESGIKKIKELGLSCMEVEFVRGVTVEAVRAKEIRELAEKEGVTLTVHASYFINLASADLPKVHASKYRILESSRIGALMGAKSVTFHPAYYGGRSSEEIEGIVKKWLIEITAELRKEGLNIAISPETTGKPSQFGSLEENIKLAQEIQGVKLCVDFAHLYTRGIGKLNSYGEFIRILEEIEGGLGKQALQELHIHMSGIRYGQKGELKHLELEHKENEFKYKEVLQALSEKGVGGYLICESPTLEQDAIILRKEYKKLVLANSSMLLKDK